MIKREIIEELLLRYNEGVTSEEESNLIEEWLETSEENRKIARQIQLIGLASNIIEVSSVLNVEKALAKTHRKMKYVSKKGRHIFLFKGMPRAVAIIIIPLLLSWCLLYLNKSPQEMKMIEVKTDPGMTASITLPDSTVVILNSSSSLQYPSLFTYESREVKLKGEAFFSVKKEICSENRK